MADTKERVIWALKCLLELVENDSVRADEIENLTTAEIIERAEAEAEKAHNAATDLQNTPD